MDKNEKTRVKLHTCTHYNIVVYDVPTRLFATDKLVFAAQVGQRKIRL